MLPPALRDRFLRLGNALTPEAVEQTRLALTPHALSPAAVACRIERDIPYGPHERHRLDLFHPDRATATTPVLVYVHGGGFSHGDKGGADAPFYNNFGLWAARCGFVGITVNYRLAPEAQWPDGGLDIALATAWIANNTALHGGSAERIFLVGQSAGAIHVAEALRRLDAMSKTVAGAALLSGIFDLERHERMFFEDGYYGTSPAVFGNHSTLQDLFRLRVPTMFTVSQLDPVQFQRQAAWVVEAAIVQTGRWPEIYFLPDHNHLSPAQVIGADFDDVGPLLAGFVERRLTALAVSSAPQPGIRTGSDQP